MDHVVVAAAEQPSDMLAVNDALQRFEKVDPQRAHLIKLRNFGGLHDSRGGGCTRSIEVVRDVIDRTTTRPGLRVVMELARKLYPKGIKAAPESLEDENVIHDRTLPLYNYIFKRA